MYPWGNQWPPAAEWNYHGEEGAHPTHHKIAGHRDAAPVTAPVERSGRNDWGLFGVGGNVWEYTIKADGTVDALRGASWDWDEQRFMCCDYRLPKRAWPLHAGFRLVLAPSAAAAAP